MKYKFIILFIFVLFFNNLYSQLKLSSNYFEIGNWDDELNEYSFYFQNGTDTTIFEIDENLSQLTLTRGTIITLYKINKINEEDNFSTIYTVTCESCNDFHRSTVKFVKILVDLKNEFIGIYTISDHTNLVRYRINKILK